MLDRRDTVKEVRSNLAKLKYKKTPYGETIIHTTIGTWTVAFWVFVFYLAKLSFQW